MKFSVLEEHRYFCKWEENIQIFFEMLYHNFINDKSKRDLYLGLTPISQTKKKPSKNERTLEQFFIKELTKMEKSRQDSLRKLENVRELYGKIKIDEKILLCKRLAEEKLSSEGIIEVTKKKLKTE